MRWWKIWWIYTTSLQVYTTKTIIYTDSAMRTRIKWIVHSSTFEQTHEDTHVCGFCYHKSSAERHCRYHKKERNCHNNSIYEPLNDIIIIIFFIPLLLKCCGKEVLMFVLIEIFYYIFVEIDRGKSLKNWKMFWRRL